jgi:hypothetical protein
MDRALSSSGNNVTAITKKGFDEVGAVVRVYIALIDHQRCGEESDVVLISIVTLWNNGGALE